MNGDKTVSRRSVLKATSATIVGGAAVSGVASAQPPELLASNFQTAAQGGKLRIDNNNGVAARVKVDSNGSTDGNIYIVGANQAGSGASGGPKGKLVDAECGENIFGLFFQRPNEDDWQYASTGVDTITC